MAVNLFFQTEPYRKQAASFGMMEVRGILAGQIIPTTMSIIILKKLTIVLAPAFLFKGTFGTDWGGLMNNILQPIMKTQILPCKFEIRGIQYIINLNHRSFISKV